MEINLMGKVALVTGASRGIGRATALRLAKSGADVAVNFRTEQNKAEEVAGEIRRMGRKSIALQADVANSKEVDGMVERVVEIFGGVDVLVNNAGFAGHTEVIRTTDEEWHRVVNVDLVGPFYVSRAAARNMVKRGKGGRIIGISSGAGHSGRPGSASYCASKAGLILFSKTLAIELAPYSINVNTVSVGYVEVGKYDTPELTPLKKDILPRILLRRPGKPEDIAAMVTFLASEFANWITGADFRVDGGESAGRIPVPLS